MTEVVRDAGQYLAVVGLRSRDAAYLDAIVAVLVQRPYLVHYRVLFSRRATRSSKTTCCDW